jgi:hypothetical protein
MNLVQNEYHFVLACTLHTVHMLTSGSCSFNQKMHIFSLQQHLEFYTNLCIPPDITSLDTLEAVKASIYVQ